MAASSISRAGHSRSPPGKPYSTRIDLPAKMFRGTNKELCYLRLMLRPDLEITEGDYFYLPNIGEIVQSTRYIGWVPEADIISFIGFPTQLLSDTGVECVSKGIRHLLGVDKI